MLVPFFGLLVAVIAVAREVEHPQGWSLTVSASPEERLRFHLALASPNVAEFEQAALDIATPGNPSYGQYLTHKSLDHLLHPNKAVLLEVFQWLRSVGIDEGQVTRRSNTLVFTAAVRQATSLLNTTFNHYVDSTGQDVIRTTHYSVPKPLDGHIEMIQPTTRFPRTRPLASLILPHKSSFRGADVKPSRPDPALTFDPILCNTTITPGCLRGLYRLENSTIPEDSIYTLGIAGFLNQYARYEDWQSFARVYAPWARGTNFSAVGANPQDDDENDNQEASLDIQYTMSLAPGVRTVFYSTPGLGPLIPDHDQPDTELNSNEPFLDHLHYMASLADNELPRVISYSYGENEQSVPRDYAIQVCRLFAQLGSRGVSIIAASGDDGPGDSCLANDGRNTIKFLPMFPASCPWVTAVGGTYQVEPEISAYFSGGGFSEVFYGLDYQKRAVEQYLNATGSRFHKLYQPKGRAYPDVAAQSWSFWVTSKGNDNMLSGTSAAAPIWAAIVGNLNSIRSSQGKASLGFLNPWLYSLEQGLTDIVDGGSAGCFGTSIGGNESRGVVSDAGWVAAEGWDAVTGLGTPIFDELVAAMP